MMKKLIIVVILAILNVCMVVGQENKSILQRLKAKYDFVHFDDSDGGWYSVSNGFEGCRGACNKQGIEVLAPVWDAVYLLGDYFKVKKNGNVGIYDLGGKELLPCSKYTEIDWFQKADDDYRGCCKVKIGNKVGIIDKNNTEIIPCDKYTDIYWYQLNKYGYCEASANGKRGVLDGQGKEIIPCKYDAISVFMFKDGDYCEVEQNGKQGVVDKQGKEIIPCKYDDIFSSDLKEKKICKVMLFENNTDSKKRLCKLGLVNILGEEILSPIYSYIQFENGYARVGKGGTRYENEYDAIGAKYALYDITQKKFLTEFKYDQLNYVNKEEGLVGFNIGGRSSYTGKSDFLGTKEIGLTGGKWGFIDLYGKEIIKAQYDKVGYFDDGVCQVIKDGVTSMITNPLHGTTLKLSGGENICEVDRNIPQTGREDENMFAFVFSIENYAHLKGADFAINDGKIFAEYCKKTLGVPEKNLHYYEDATYGNLVGAMKKIKDIADVYDGDAKLVVYFAGLGATDNKSKECYLLPSDATFETIAKTGYAVSELLRVLNSLNTVYTIVLFDAPFSNVDRTGKMLAAARGVQIAPKQVTPMGNVAVCTASQGNETAFASKNYGHGLFTYALLQYLQSTKGNCTIKEMVDVTSKWVSKEALKQYDKTQMPTLNVSEKFKVEWTNIKF